MLAETNVWQPFNDTQSANHIVNHNNINLADLQKQISDLKEIVCSHVFKNSAYKQDGNYRSVFSDSTKASHKISKGISKNKRRKNRRNTYEKRRAAEAGQKTKWRRPTEFFSEDDFSSALVEAPTNFKYNSLKTKCCSGENVSAILPRAFWRNHKGVGMFQDCLQNENGDIFRRSTLGCPSVLFLRLSLAFFQSGVDPLGEF